MKYISIVLFVFLSASSFAQTNLKISFVEGTVNILSGNSVVPAHKGSRISKNSTIQLKERSLCMILDTNGRSVQLKEAGNYTFDNISKLISSSKEDHTLSGLYKYLKDNLLASHHSDDRSGIVAGVYRGVDLMEMPFDFSILFGGDIVITWKSPSAKGKVRLTIKDSMNKAVDSVFKPSGKPTNSFTLSTKMLKSGNSYEWKAELTPTRQPLNSYHHFLVADKADETEIQKDLKILQNKKYDKKIIDDLRKDIFLKWKAYYASRQASL
jgi:hypothetical protein